MQILILGAGEVGFHTALRLSREGHNVVLIDRDPERVRQVNERMDVQTLLGSASSPQVLKDAAIAEADLVVAVTDVDEINLQACRFARVLAPSTTRVARIRSEDILDFMEEHGSRALDVDTVINPEREVTSQVLQFLAVPAASTVADFGAGAVKLLGLRLPVTSPLVGRTLAELRAGGPPFLVAAIERGGQVIVPGGGDRLLADDLAYLVVREELVKTVVGHFGLHSEPVRSLVVVGGGAIGRLVAGEASRRGIKTRIIESDAERCRTLADALPEVIVLKGDGTDLSLLEEENVGAADVFAAMTSHEEENVLMALLGRKLGARRTVARVAHLGYVPLVSSLGIDLVVSPRFAAVSGILRHLRRGRVLAVTALPDENAEVIEVEAQETSALVGRPLAEVRMPAGALVAAVIRGGEVIIPDGRTVVAPKDHLVVFLLRRVLGKVEKLLTVSLEYF